MIKPDSKKAIIFGAGPAGLTAAYELLDRTDIEPVVFELTSNVGGISKTINYKGNRIDIGGHRFFSKSRRIMDWWSNILPVSGFPAKDDIVLGRELSLESESRIRKIREKQVSIESPPDPEKSDNVMLCRNRISRILYLRKFYDYPISLKFQTLKNLGVLKSLKIMYSFSMSKILPKKVLSNLEDFFISRFGYELYFTFFKDYTEKVWGVSCRDISAEWGAQRIKGLSVAKAVTHALKKLFVSGKKDINQKGIETSLIESFLYPKFGPGQMWETVSSIVNNNGGIVKTNFKIVGVIVEENIVKSVKVKNCLTGEIYEEYADYFFSSLPVRELILCMEPSPGKDIVEKASNLIYRDFMTAGLLLSKLKVKNTTKLRTVNDLIPDNWIYVQESDVKLGRIQIFNNWSPYMVENEDDIWIGLEYFCNEGDELWNMSDDDFLKLVIKELEKIDFIDANDVKDGCVIREPKAYPSYVKGYEHIDEIINYLNKIENLFLVGRNGMHRYNNMDHSMMSSMVAVENIINNVKTKDNLWKINIEDEYHEEGTED